MHGGGKGIPSSMSGSPQGQGCEYGNSHSIPADAHADGERDEPFLGEEHQSKPDAAEERRLAQETDDGEPAWRFRKTVRHPKTVPNLAQRPHDPGRLEIACRHEKARGRQRDRQQGPGGKQEDEDEIGNESTPPAKPAGRAKQPITA